MAFGGRRWPEELDVELREASGLCFNVKSSNSRDHTKARF